MKKIAILIDEKFEDSEFIYPYYRLIEAGMQVDVIAKNRGEYRGKHGTAAKAAFAIGEVSSSDYTALYIPGGRAPERLREQEAMVDFVRTVYEAGKPVCAVCHGPLLLAAAGVIGGKRITGYPSTKEELKSAGAVYTGKDVEMEGSLITAQDPRAMPEMMKRFLPLLQM
jgi:protease I